MSKILINQYYNNLDRTIQFGKSKNEQSIRNHFWLLLNEYARKQSFEVVAEVACMGIKGKPVRPDGIVKRALPFARSASAGENKQEAAARNRPRRRGELDSSRFASPGEAHIKSR